MSRFTVLLAFASCIALHADDSPARPITRDGFFRAVEIGGLEPDEFASLVRQHRVEFRLSGDDRDKLRAAGLDRRVIDAVDASFLPPPSNEILAGPPLNATDIGGLLRGGTPSALVERAVGTRGVTFQLTAESAREIEKAGGGKGLLGALVLAEPVAPPVPVAPAPVPAPQPETGTGIIEVSKQVQAARLLTRPLVHYPFAARQARVSGVVRFDATIGADGRVEKLRVLSGHPLLIGGADREVSKFVYVPAKVDGKPVRVKTEIELTFRLPD
ncbi:MAG: energy transducer TonB [Bryobacteraceae bacterium]